MLDDYFIGRKGVMTTDEDHSNWLVIDSSNTKEIEQVIKKYELPQDIFVGVSYPEEVSRMEELTGTSLNQPISLVLLNLSNEKETIEKRLTPISFVYSNDLLISCVDKKTDFFVRLIEKYGQVINTFEKAIAYSILEIYTHFVKELKVMKKKIDALDKEARKTTENEELYKQADLEREIVYIDHTLRDQKATLDQLWKSESFVKKLTDDGLLYDIQLRQRQAEKMILIYRDLLESIGDLFNGMMDNHLNHFMKYLDSAALIISIPALIAGIWGMNTGGLPGERSGLGFLFVLIGSIVAAGIVGYHLYRKDYTK